MSNFNPLSVDLLILVVAYGLTLRPASWLIRRYLDKWVELIVQNSDSDSLINAGKIIGYLERTLILTFVLLGQFTAVGFILVLKAAYRFKDTGNHPQAEYMLVGTFLSLAITLAIGITASYLIQS